MNYNGLILLLAVLLLGACADTDQYRGRRNSLVNLAETCATCGATIQDNYFADTAFSSSGPGHQ